MADVKIAPSILSADFANLEAECREVMEGGADLLHLDVMDGHFVDNISFGPAIVEAVHATNDIFLDVHLMITRPDHYFPRFVKAGADMITVHAEARHDVAATLVGIRDAGCRCGLALNPSTPLEEALPHLDHIDLLLCMTVVPGFGGQSFMPEVMPKVREAAAIREERGLSFHIEVDGGIDPQTAVAAGAAGANVFVAGSSTFGAPSMSDAVAAIRRA